MKAKKLDKRYEAYKDGFRAAIFYDDEPAPFVHAVDEAVTKLKLNVAEYWRGKYRWQDMYMAFETEEDMLMALLAAR